MDRFESVYDANEGITWSRRKAHHIITRVHQASWEEFLCDVGADEGREAYDAQVVLGWLGY